jgi:hypothetical protein
MAHRDALPDGPALPVVERPDQHPRDAVQHQASDASDAIPGVAPQLADA